MWGSWRLGGSVAACAAVGEATLGWRWISRAPSRPGGGGGQASGDCGVRAGCGDGYPRARGRVASPGGCGSSSPEKWRGEEDRQSAFWVGALEAQVLGRSAVFPQGIPRREGSVLGTAGELQGERDRSTVGVSGPSLLRNQLVPHLRSYHARRHCSEMLPGQQEATVPWQLLQPHPWASLNSETIERGGWAQNSFHIPD